MKKVLQIHQFFKDKLGEKWSEGSKALNDSECSFSFIRALSVKQNQPVLHLCLIISYDVSLKLLTFHVGIQHEELLTWQKREVSSLPKLQHFSQNLFILIPEKEIWENEFLSEFGGWNYDTRSSQKNLSLALEDLWSYCEKYSKSIFKFYGTWLKEYGGNSDSSALMKKRQWRLNRGWAFFGNEMEFKLALAALNQHQGHKEIAHLYLKEVESLLSNGSTNLRKRVRKGIQYIKTGKGNYPELTTVHSLRL